MKILKRQKGYAVLMMMAFSVVSLSLVSTSYVVKNNESLENKRENIITDTARQTVEFSAAVSKKLNGAGAVPGEKISIADLKLDKLITPGFPSSIAFEQNIMSYYVTNPSNKNIIDFLITIEGEANEKFMQNMGVSKETLGSFYNQVIERGKSIGYSAAEEADEFHIGIITNNGNTLSTKDGDINISHIPINYTDDTFGIYSKAANQSGYWRFRVGPYAERSRPNLQHRRNDLEGFLVSFLTTSSPRKIDNEGFTYYCPDDYIKVSRNGTLSEHQKNMSIDKIKICIETYKGSVKPNLSSIEYSQFMNPINETTQKPFDTKPELWGRCVVSDVYYQKGQGSEPAIGTTCGGANRLFNVINESDIIGFRKHVLLKSWDGINNNRDRNLYDPNFRDKFDFEVGNVMFTSSINMELDNKYVRFYTYGGRFLTGKSNTYDSTHNNNFLYGAGVDISNTSLSEMVKINEGYLDDNGVSRNIVLNIPTPKQ